MTDPHEPPKPGRLPPGFKRLASSYHRHVREEQADDDSDIDLPIEVDDEEPTTVNTTTKHDPRAVLVAVAISAALTAKMKEALNGNAPQAVVVTVPSEDWLHPVRDFFERRAFGRKWICIARDGSDRARHKPASVTQRSRPTSRQDSPSWASPSTPKGCSRPR